MHAVHGEYAPDLGCGDNGWCELNIRFVMCAQGDRRDRSCARREQDSEAGDAARELWRIANFARGKSHDLWRLGGRPLNRDVDVRACGGFVDIGAAHRADQFSAASSRFDASRANDHVVAVFDLHDDAGGSGRGLARGGAPAQRKNSQCENQGYGFHGLIEIKDDATLSPSATMGVASREWAEVGISVFSSLWVVC